MAGEKSEVTLGLELQDGYRESWVIILLDNTGFGLPSTFGGPINTPTLSELADEGISYNAFHTTVCCYRKKRTGEGRAQVIGGIE